STKPQYSISSMPQPDTCWADFNEFAGDFSHPVLWLSARAERNRRSPDRKQARPRMSAMGSQADMRDRSRVRAPRLLRELTRLRQQTREMRIELHRLKQVDAVAVAERAEGVALN